MPFYTYRCQACGRVDEQLRSRDDEAIVCPCGDVARRDQVYPVNFTHGDLLHDVPLKSLHEAAQEMEYQVNRTDDPQALKAGNRIAHAAKVRSEGRMLAGATTYNPEVAWNHEEIT